MRHSMFAVLAVTVGFVASGAWAQITPGSYDLNGDKRLGRSELDRLKADVAALPTGPERTHYEDQVDVAEHLLASTGQPVPVSEIAAYVPLRTCASNKGRFVLMDRISDKRLTGCDRIETSGGPRYNPFNSGASLSYSDDSSVGGSSYTIKAGLGYVFPWSAPGGLNSGTSITDRGFALFLEADGTKNGNAKDAGTLRMGVKAEFVFGSSAIPALPLSIVGYAQSDLNLDGRAYGVEASLTPYNARAHINSWIGEAGENYYTFVIKPTLDAFHVEDAGTSALVAGESYAWLGGEFGAQVFARKLLGNGMTFSVGADAYWDLNSGQEAIDGYARLDVFVNPERTAAFQIEYRNGVPRTTLIERDALNVGVALAF